VASGIRWIVAAGALALTLAAHAHLPLADSAGEGSPLAPSAQHARLLSLGFDALAADLYWLRAVQRIGAEPGNPWRHASAVGRLAETVVALDPWVDHPYRFAALWMSDDPRELAAANRLLERGIAYHPRDWRNRFYLSFNHFFHRGDTAAAARELEPAVGLPGAPFYLGRLLARLRSEAGDLEAAAAYLEELGRSAEQPWHREEYARALVEIETERRARALDRAREAFRARHGFDIRRVEELAWGPHSVIFTLPPEPNGFGWELDPATGQIVSGYYKRRYRLNFHRELADRRAGGGAPAARPSGGEG
jgi:tetratricopeptide (TPR) repeat protein